MKILTYIILFSALFSYGTKNSISNETAEYLTEVVDLLENNSIKKNEINWNEFRKDVFSKAKSSKTIEEVYPAVTYAISKLNDNHSYFKPVTEIMNDSENNPLPVLLDEKTPEDIGYIRIPFCIGTEDDINEYISSISSKIKLQNNSTLKGWVIDLRGNFGGNMWPMLLSIEPLIGNGTLGYFVDADNNFEAWKLENGKVFVENQLIYENLSFVALDLSNQYLAVLTDNETASSGEAVAVALKNRNYTKSFGTSTYGVSTGCVSHPLSDGSRINLAETVFADRNKNKYGDKISPDSETNVGKTLQQGIQWIYEMNQ